MPTCTLLFHSKNTSLSTMFRILNIAHSNKYASLNFITRLVQKSVTFWIHLLFGVSKLCSLAKKIFCTIYGLQFPVCYGSVFFYRCYLGVLYGFILLHDIKKNGSLIHFESTSCCDGYKQNKTKHFKLAGTHSHRRKITISQINRAQHDNQLNNL